MKIPSQSTHPVPGIPSVILAQMVVHQIFPCQPGCLIETLLFDIHVIGIIVEANHFAGLYISHIFCCIYDTVCNTRVQRLFYISFPGARPTRRELSLSGLGPLNDLDMGQERQETGRYHKSRAPCRQFTRQARNAILFPDHSRCLRIILSDFACPCPKHYTS